MKKRDGQTQAIVQRCRNVFRRKAGQMLKKSQYRMVLSGQLLHHCLFFYNFGEKYKGNYAIVSIFLNIRLVIKSMYVLWQKW